MNDKLDLALGTQATALTLRARRQQAISSNIANADTPGYQAVDVDFSKSFRNVQTNNTAELKVTASGHQQSTSAFAGLSTVRRVSLEAAADGNSVDMDVERARFADNAVRYEAALRFLNGKIKTLLSAVQGQ
jgi:flagellar basal-body rod protein FlgB